MLSAVGNDLIYLYQDDPIGPLEQILIPPMQNLRPAIDPKACAVLKIQEEAPYMGIDENITDTHEGAVTIKIGKRERTGIEQSDQPIAATFEGTVTAPLIIAGGKEKVRRTFEALQKRFRNPIPQELLPTARIPGFSSAPGILCTQFTPMEVLFRRHVISPFA